MKQKPFFKRQKLSPKSRFQGSIRKVKTLNRLKFRKEGKEEKMSQTLEEFGMKMNLIRPVRKVYYPRSSRNNSQLNFTFSQPATRAHSPNSSKLNLDFGTSPIASIYRPNISKMMDHDSADESNLRRNQSLMLPGEIKKRRSMRSNMTSFALRRMDSYLHRLKYLED